MFDFVNFLLLIFSRNEAARLGESESRHASRIKMFERDLARKSQLLELLISCIREEKIESPGLNAIVARYDDHHRQVFQLEEDVITIVDEITKLLDQKSDLAALQTYRRKTNCIWDRCHEVIGSWTRWNIEERRSETLRDLQKKMEIVASTNTLAMPSR